MIKHTEGEKVTEEKCPKCQDTLVVAMEGEAQVFTCKNCKFKIKKITKEKK